MDKRTTTLTAYLGNLGGVLETETGYQEFHDFMMWSSTESNYTKHIRGKYHGYSINCMRALQSVFNTLKSEIQYEIGRYTQDIEYIFLVLYANNAMPENLADQKEWSKEFREQTSSYKLTKLDFGLYSGHHTFMQDFGDFEEAIENYFFCKDMIGQLQNILKELEAQRDVSELLETYADEANPRMDNTGDEIPQVMFPQTTTKIISLIKVIHPELSDIDELPSVDDISTSDMEYAFRWIIGQIYKYL